MRILIAPLTAMFCHGTVGPQGLTRVMFGYAAISGPHAVLWVARDAGLFEKNGLRTDVAYIRSGSTMAQRSLAFGLAALGLGMASLAYLYPSVYGSSQQHNAGETSLLWVPSGGSTILRKEVAQKLAMGFNELFKMRSFLF